MTYLYGSTLVVITLLQLCRAEISDSPPDWYSANVINDGFHPKPISEIFTTEATFSSTNPIIVLPKTPSTPKEETEFTSLPPSTLKVSSFGSTGDLTDLISRTSSTPATTMYSPEEQTQPQTVSVQIQTETPSTRPVDPVQPTAEIISESSVQPVPSTSAGSAIRQTSSGPTELVVQSREQTQTRSSQTQTQNQQIRLEITPQNQPTPMVVQSGPTFTPPPIPQPSSVTPPPNYFLIYQQAPQNIQNYPTQQRPLPVVTIQDPPSTISTTLPPITQPLTQVTIQTVPSILPGTLPQTTEVRTSLTTQVTPSTTRANVTRPNCRPAPLLKPNLNTTSRVPRRSLFPFSIRVVAPVGSITKVKINPTSTTRKPTTKRTRKSKQKSNRYDICIGSCKGKKEPICGVPVSSRHIDPKTLKGFPSVCHMACHNSFRKETYEKLVDGKCGKLRSRIRIVEPNKKWTKSELKKVEYVVENIGPHTVFEFTGKN